ncbi:MAG TPA: universal stress protein, partial [Chitinophaga sp.]
VLMVPLDAPIVPVKRALLACDLEKVSEATPLDALDKVLEAFQAQLVVINVDDGNRHFSPDTVEEIYGLHHIFDKYKPEYAFVENKDIAEGILDYAKEHDISLVITIPRYYNFLRNLFHKSTTKSLVYNSKLPLLTLHE